MLIDFDPVKNQRNLAKHGLSLLIATALDWERGWLQPDTRKDYGERRVSALVPQGEDLFFLAFVVRGEAKRIITLRRANRKFTSRFQHIEQRLREAGREGPQPLDDMEALWLEAKRIEKGA